MLDIVGGIGVSGNERERNVNSQQKSLQPGKHVLAVSRIAIDDKLIGAAAKHADKRDDLARWLEE